MASAFHYIVDEYGSKYINNCKQKSLLEIHNKGRMHFCRDILMGHHMEKKRKRLNYRIEEWHTSTPYDILRNQSTYPTVSLLLDMWQRDDHCITVFDKLKFDSNLKVAIPLKQVCLKYICCGNYTDVNKFIGVLHAIISVPPEVVLIRLNMK